MYCVTEQEESLSSKSHIMCEGQTAVTLINVLLFTVQAVCCTVTVSMWNSQGYSLDLKCLHVYFLIFLLLCVSPVCIPRCVCLSVCVVSQCVCVRVERG